MNIITATLFNLLNINHIYIFIFISKNLNTISGHSHRRRIKVSIVRWQSNTDTANKNYRLATRNLCVCVGRCEESNNLTYSCEPHTYTYSIHRDGYIQKCSALFSIHSCILKELKNITNFCLNLRERTDSSALTRRSYVKK